MLVDYLENASVELRKMEGKIQELDKQYRKYLDKQLRQEITGAKKELSRKRTEIYEEIMKSMQEIYLLKKYFPQLLDVFTEDKQIGNLLRKKSWLFDFRNVAATNDELEDLRKKRNDLSDAKDFLKKWVGRIDSKSLNATWPILKGKIKDESDRDEVIAAIEEEWKVLNKRGWLLTLREPYIMKPFRRIMKKLNKASEGVVQKNIDLEKSKGKGTLTEYNSSKELKKAQKKKRTLERKCLHLLYANPEFLMKLKGETRWSQKKIDLFADNFVKRIEFVPINEERWLREMRKRVE